MIRRLGDVGRLGRRGGSEWRNQRVNRGRKKEGDKR